MPFDEYRDDLLLDLNTSVRVDCNLNVAFGVYFANEVPQEGSHLPGPRRPKRTTGNRAFTNMRIQRNFPVANLDVPGRLESVPSDDIKAGVDKPESKCIILGP